MLPGLVSGPGGCSVEYRDPAFPDRPLFLHAARPVQWTPAVPVVIVLHGVARNGRDYRDYWAEHADTFGILPVAIEFPEASFPEYLWYNFGNLHTKAGEANPREQWTFGIPARLFQALLAAGVTTAPRYGLFGHSAGGQFVHRMLSFGYRENVAVAVSANAGTYAMPDLTVDWPWGLGAVPMDDSALREWLRFPLTVMAGTSDTKTTGRFFPKGPKSMRQGPHRHARAHTYVQMAQGAAERMGVELGWRVVDVPGVGHDGRRMSDAAAPVIAAGLNTVPVRQRGMDAG